MADNYGILISPPGVSVNNAAPGAISLNTSNPFIKIDTQNQAGFQSITLLITNEPPSPTGSNNDVYTVLYKFAHGYQYIPAIETLFYVSSPGASTAHTQTYFQDSGILSTHSPYDYALLYAVADATYVYYIVDKYLDNTGGLGLANNLSGTTVQITTHVFVEDIGI